MSSSGVAWTEPLPLPLLAAVQQDDQGSGKLGITWAEKMERSRDVALY
jgi:hypothetical protein